MIEDLIARLKRLAWYTGQIEFTREIPAQSPRYGKLSRPLPAPLSRFLSHRSTRLYSHQSAAIETGRAGNNVVLATPTASGKSLAFNLSVFERLFHDPNATALYLYPLKALANDQFWAIKELERVTNIQVHASIYDGDTPAAQRPRIRERARVILTNPYALHQYLPHHDLWERFFRHLSCVVIDEAHWYRGAFGSHVAQLMRRFIRILNRYGTDPQFILASATIANAEEHALKLTGRAFKVIQKDGAIHGPKHFILWNSLKHPDRSAHRQASGLLAVLVECGLQTLCFTVSRKMAELTAQWTKEQTRGKSIVAYRAGYRPEDRRTIEEGLKARAIDAVAATNALELGIDIGQLDAVVISGYPGTIVSTWQQAGRAGRGADPSVVILVAFEDPLDQYLVRHPDVLFEQTPEHAVIDLRNDHILSGHLLCAAAELPVTPKDVSFFGPDTPRLLKQLECEGLVQGTPHGAVHQGLSRPVDVVNLDAIGRDAVEVRCNGELIEALDLRRALVSAHEGAVFLHRGVSYVVERLDLARGIATARRESIDYYTDTMSRTSIHVLDKPLRRIVGIAKLSLGKVLVSEHVTGYRMKRYDRTLAVRELELAPVEFNTVALWFTLPEEIHARIRRARHDWVGGLHAAEHGIIHIMPLFAMCDRRDVGGLSTIFHPDTGAATVFIYDGYPGGIGISGKGYEVFADLAAATEAMLHDCRCGDGCPSCVYDRNCGNDNQPIDKRAALRILAAVRSP
jgi:DEAD/DEAH box helicase domain-containing protein